MTPDKSCVLSRQPEAHAEMNCQRAKTTHRKTTRRAWTKEEDAILYDHTVRELPTRPYVENRSDFAVKCRMQHLSLSLPTAPFPNAIFDPEAPPLLLNYSMWTPLDPARSIPPEAEVDWANACARIPQQWPLILEENNFDLQSSAGCRVQAVLFPDMPSNWACHCLRLPPMAGAALRDLRNL